MRKLIFLLIGFVILCYYFLKTDVLEVLRGFNSYFDYSMLWIIIPLMLMTPLVRALRWQYVMSRTTETEILFFESLRLTCISFFISCVTPMRLGEISKSIFYKDSKSSAMAGVSVEILFDLIMLFLIPILLLTHQLSILLLCVLLVVFIFVVFVLVASKIKLVFVTKIISYVLGRRVNFQQKQKEFEETTRKLVKTPSVTIICIVSSTFLYLNYYFCTYLIFKALGLEIGLVTSMRALSLSQAIGFISTIPMGLGARETAAMTYFGNENSLIFMGLLLSRLLTLFYILLGFCFYMSHPAGVKQRPDIK